MDVWTTNDATVESTDRYSYSSGKGISFSEKCTKIRRRSKQDFRKNTILLTILSIFLHLPSEPRRTITFGTGTMLFSTSTGIRVLLSPSQLSLTRSGKKSVPPLTLGDTSSDTFVRSLEPTTAVKTPTGSNMETDTFTSGSDTPPSKYYVGRSNLLNRRNHLFLPFFQKEKHRLTTPLTAI